MLSQVDPATFVRNLALILGGLVLLAALFVLTIAVWTGTNAVRWFRGQRRVEAAVRKATRRADGKLYPPYIEGVCDECHRGDRKVYFPPTTKKGLCSLCYEPFWRRTEGWTDPVEPEACEPPAVD
ncbi:MAG: hypothetical protein ACE5EX_08835 [Phycisphaerae bacterium]